MTGYEKDLAFIHDAGFGNFALEAAPPLVRILRTNGIRRGHVVDLGCGTGIWAQKLIEAGYSVLGIDISPAMIRRARRRAPKATFLTGSIFDFPVRECDAVTSIGEIVNYTFDPRNSKPELSRLFRRIFRGLRPGGVFVFDFAEPPEHWHEMPQKSFHEGEDWAVLVERRHGKRRRILVREITAFRRVGKFFQRSDETHVLKLYDASELESELAKIGFETHVRRAYGRMTLPPAHAAIVARKPSA